MSDTVLQLITDALKEIRVLQAGESPTAADANDTFRRLNLMLDTLTLDQLTCPVDATESIAFTASKFQYTFGPGGDINTTRAPDIKRAWVQISTGQDIPLRKLYEPEWDAISLKTTTAEYPYVFWYDPAYPLGVVNVWPVPQGAGNTLFIRHRTNISQFASLSTVISLQPGYQEYYTIKLAIKVAPYFGRAAKSAAMELATTLENIQLKIQRQNVPLRIQKLDNDAPKGGDRGQMNILTGERYRITD